MATPSKAQMAAFEKKDAAQDIKQGIKDNSPIDKKKDKLGLLLLLKGAPKSKGKKPSLKTYVGKK